MKFNQFAKNSRLKNYLHLISIVIVTASVMMLVYPFLGQLEYRFARLAKSQETVSEKDATWNAVATGLIVRNESMKNYLAAASVAYSQLQTAAGAKAGPEKIKFQAATVKPAGQVKAAVKPQAAKISAPKDKLYIPSINVEIDIVEGKTATALNKGAWRLPGTSTPELGGNTVLGGHRWMYKPPSKKTFYNLDKVKPGDRINVTWQGQNYQYKVREIKTVDPKEIQILYNTEDSILTLFTCTPLFSSKQRLVVIAEKI